MIIYSKIKKIVTENNKTSLFVGDVEIKVKAKDLTKVAGIEKGDYVVAHTYGSGKDIFLEEIFVSNKRK